VADGRDLQPRREGTNWRAWVLGVVIVLVIVFIAQNSQSVRVDFLFWDASAPLIFALLITTLVGVVIGYVGPIVRRHRRERSQAPD
jgi:uncharacterized integral membrane protein